MCCIAANDEDRLSLEEKPRPVSQCSGKLTMAPNHSRNSMPLSCQSIESHSPDQSPCSELTRTRISDESQDDMSSIDTMADANSHNSPAQELDSKWAVSRTESLKNVQYDEQRSRAMLNMDKKFVSGPNDLDKQRNSISGDNSSLTLIQNYVSDTFTSDSEMDSSENLSRGWESVRKPSKRLSISSFNKENAIPLVKPFQQSCSRTNNVCEDVGVHKTDVPKRSTNCMAPREIRPNSHQSYKSKSKSNTQCVYVNQCDPFTKPDNTRPKSLSGAGTHPQSTMQMFTGSKQLMTTRHGDTSCKEEWRQYEHVTKTKVQKNETNESRKRQNKYIMTSAVTTGAGGHPSRYVTRVDVFSRGKGGASSWLSVPVKETEL